MSLADGTVPTGILLIDKPEGMTSHDVVSRIRKKLGLKKVGHAGTLDPMATGMLVAGVGSSTRLLTFLVGADKEYVATIRLGSTTVTDDREGETLKTAPEEAIRAITPERLSLGIRDLTGDIKQRPSAVSAIKVAGKRAYDRVRSGESVDLPARPVTVSEFVIVDVPRPVYTDKTLTALDCDVRVVCSSGTYIRALARDLGDALGVGGHLTALRRTRVGPFDIKDAVDLDADNLADQLRGAASVASHLFPTLSLSAEQTLALEQGKRVRVGQTEGAGHAWHAPIVAALAPDGRLVGLVSVTRGETRVIVNFPVVHA
ncbi:tRNA pseudouridine(55) synthase TruB [Lysinibacter sp. HNR]|uniref:tRNA pseudouridine(55) synthase TruB n=1 Tax=Lysinibacter sp. HNR TaxID=3031408 RepID=UPI0024359423|nr:tRNA pseudouridine(55) synthase TruB [Lysinibacter sp. HNR]WGD36695.1 tRNA pseudouridine(55) synthase TruB [Lysinibacter sp. HNR]